MKHNRDFFSRLMWALFKAAALGILLFFALLRADWIWNGMNVMVSVLMPFIVGGVIAYILKPMCNFLEKQIGKRLPRQAAALSVTLTMLLAFFVVGVLLVLVVPSLLQSIYTIALMIPNSVQRFSEWLLKVTGDNEVLSNYIQNLSGDLSTTLSDWLSGKLVPGLQKIAGSVASGMGSVISFFKNAFMGCIVAIYLLVSRKKFAEQAKKILYSAFSRKWADRILEEVIYADRMFCGFISGRLMDSLIIGVICFVALMILGIPYAMLVSVIVGVTNIIPFFGPFIGAVPSFLLILIADPIKSLIFVVFVVILQQFDGNILGPKILGNVTGLSSFWVLFSILFFGGLFGFVGMLIGVPVFAVIYDVIRKLVYKGLEYRRAQEEGE
ncbi:MAG: AI-2E family transporter [Clostridiales bacterium]|nr:AI-2E family transporter [Clostridiales bacterium]